jgi:hypothetical protein
MVSVLAVTRAQSVRVTLRLDGPVSAFMTFSRISGSRCEYQDETQVPEEFELVNGLRLTLPNGDILIIAERHAKKKLKGLHHILAHYRFHGPKQPHARWVRQLR